MSITLFLAALLPGQPVAARSPFAGKWLMEPASRPRRAVERQRVANVLLAAEILVVWVLDPARVDHLIGPAFHVLEQVQEPAILLSVGPGPAGRMLFLQIERHLGRAAS